MFTLQKSARFKDPKLDRQIEQIIAAINTIGRRSMLQEHLNPSYLVSYGKPGGQTLCGGINAGESLVLQGTSHATPGPIVLNPSGGYVGVGKTPECLLDCLEEKDGVSSIQIKNASTGQNAMVRIQVSNNAQAGWNLGQLGSMATGWPHYGAPGEGFIYHGSTATSLNIIVADPTSVLNFYVGTSAAGTKKMQINSNRITINPPIAISDGTASAPALTFNNALDTGLYHALIGAGNIKTLIITATSVPVSTFSASAGNTGYCQINIMSPSATGFTSGHWFSFRVHGDTYATSGAYRASSVFMGSSILLSDGLSIAATHISAPIRFYTGGTADANERIRISSGGNVGIRVTSPTAYFHLAAGTATPGSAPLKFTSGALLSTPEAGAVEFLWDKAYLTISTGPARKEFALCDTALTAGRVPYATMNGRLADSGSLLFDGTSLQAGGYKAADASPGISCTQTIVESVTQDPGTKDITVTTKTITCKNGLITAIA